MFILILCFILPILGSIRATLIGEFSLCEAILVLIFIYNIPKISALWRIPVARRLIVLGFLWFISQVFSDLYRGTPSEDYLRGWSKIACLLFFFSSFFFLIGGNIKRCIAFCLGIVVQPVVYNYVYPQNLPFYKFVIGFAVAELAFFMSGGLRLRFGKSVLLIPFAAAILALIFDARSLFGMTIGAIGYALVADFIFGSGRISRAKIFMILLTFFSLSYGVISAYSYFASTGNLSESAVAKYEDQIGDTGKFTLLSGRSELKYSLPKIMSSPIIGWGSWAKDMGYVMEQTASMGGDAERAARETGGLIPTHSHIFGAWVEAGIVGAFFWLFVLYILLKLLFVRTLAFTGIWKAFFAFILISFIWDIVFSPFGGDRRVIDGFYLWVVILFLARTDQIAVPHQRVASSVALPTSQTLVKATISK
jgi:hypothetical protein